MHTCMYELLVSEVCLRLARYDLQLAIALCMTCDDVCSSQRWVLSSPAVANITVTMSWEDREIGHAMMHC